MARTRELDIMRAVHAVHALGEPSSSVSKRRTQWWVGVLTILFFTFCGIGLSVAIQAGMTFHYPDAPEVFNTIFVYMGFPGRLAQFVYGGDGAVLTASQRFYGEHLCITVNAIAYTVCLLAWFLRPGETRLMRANSAPARNPWRHSHD